MRTAPIEQRFAFFRRRGFGNLDIVCAAIMEPCRVQHHLGRQRAAIIDETIDNGAAGGELKRGLKPVGFLNIARRGVLTAGSWPRAAVIIL